MDLAQLMSTGGEGGGSKADTPESMRGEAPAPAADSPTALPKAEGDAIPKPQGAPDNAPAQIFEPEPNAVSAETRAAGYHIWSNTPHLQVGPIAEPARNLLERSGAQPDPLDLYALHTIYQPAMGALPPALIERPSLMPGIGSTDLVPAGRPGGAELMTPTPGVSAVPPGTNPPKTRPRAGEGHWYDYIAPGIRKRRERQEFKDLMAAGDINDPQVQRDLMLASPELAAQAGLSIPAITQMRQQRGIDQIIGWQNGNNAAQRAYLENIGPDGSHQKGAEAGQKAWSQHLQLMRQQYGKTFADSLPQVWNIDDSARIGQSLKNVSAAHEKLYYTRTADGQVAVKSLLPGYGTSDWTQKNPGGFIREQTGGSDIPGKYRAATKEEAAGAQGSEGGTGQIDVMSGKFENVTGPTVVSDAQRAQRKEFEDAQGNGANAYTIRENAFRNALDSLRDGKGGYKNDRVSNMKLFMFQSQLENANPTLTIGPGNVETLGQQGLLPGVVQTGFNEFLQGKDGKLSDSTLRKIDESLGETMAQYRKSHGAYRTSQTVIEEDKGWKPGVITDGHPFMSDKEFDELRLKPPTDTRPAPPPAVSAQNRQEAQGRLATILDPNQPPAAVATALKAVPDAELQKIDVTRMTTQQLQLLLAEQKRRGW